MNCTGSIDSPSPNRSRAIAFREPGDCPPMSTLCPMLAQNAMTSSPANTGMTTTMSLGWGQPEWYGWFVRKQSPSRISSTS